MSNTKRILLIVFAFIVLAGICVLGVFYKTPEKTETVSPDNSSANYLRTSKEMLYVTEPPDIPTYRAYVDLLDKDCPYYQPGGFQYRECLATLLKKKDKTAESLYLDWVKEAGANNNLIMAISRLHKSWKEYRDSLCDMEIADTKGGSNESGFLNTCKLYQTEIYTKRLIWLANNQ